MKTRTLLLSGVAGIGFLFATSASAHTFGAHGAGFGEELVHPLLGIDHLLAMIAVGFWAAQLGGKALWQVPLAFVAMMAGGALIANIGIDASLVEAMIAASVIFLGLMIAGSIKLPPSVSVIVVSAFALFHGYAHGLEMPQAGAPLAYGAGFVLATGCLHLIGVGLGISASRMRILTRVGGAAIAATGLYLLVGA